MEYNRDEDFISDRGTEHEQMKYIHEERNKRLLSDMSSLYEDIQASIDEYRSVVDECRFGTFAQTAYLEKLRNDVQLPYERASATFHNCHMTTHAESFPIYKPWSMTFYNVADVLVRAERRGFFKMKDRDRNLCEQIKATARITQNQMNWLGGISSEHLQNGMHEEHTWWSADPERNLLNRWETILSAATDPTLSIDQVEEVVGGAFMARYQKVLLSKS